MKRRQINGQVKRPEQPPTWSLLGIFLLNEYPFGADTGRMLTHLIEPINIGERTLQVSVTKCALLSLKQFDIPKVCSLVLIASIE